MTTRHRYLEDSYLDHCRAEVTGIDDGWLRLSETVAYPGGGGQPRDRMTIVVSETPQDVVDMLVDDDGGVWIRVEQPVSVGTPVTCRIDWAFRYALMRHHALMHVVNTVAERAYQGEQTATQLGPERSRVDFAFPSFERALLADFEVAVNEVIGRDLPISASIITEAEYVARPELVRTRDVAPPVENGVVRIVQIHGFEAQACGGTHVHSTREIGRGRIDGYENKGRHNKRLYWVLVA